MHETGSLALIASGPSWQLHRALDSAGHPVSVKTHALTRSQALARCFRELEILRSLDTAVTPRALEIDVEGTQPGLVLQDLADCQMLTQIVGGPRWSLERYFAIVPRLCAAIGEIHQAGIVHKALRPEHILIRPSNDVLVIGFEQATRIRVDEASWAGPSDLTTLRYRAPEQTGRMNRSIDYRCDLYTLGVMMFELLDGGPVFVADDAVGMLHALIAVPSPSIKARRSEVPVALDGIISKLLAKTPEERYQNAFAVADDLELVAAAWRSGSELPVERLGRTDRCTLPIQSQNLYGRDREVRQLVELFRRPERRLVVLAGPSGIGKTMLVGEVQRLAHRHGYFATGKYDQTVAMPFSGIRQALVDLIDQVSDDIPELRTAIASRLAAELGPGVGVLLRFLPTLRSLLPETTIAAEVGGGDQAGLRFRLLVRKLVEILVRRDHPVVLFVDDVQWIDAASVRLIEELVGAEEISNLIVVAAYREDEVDDSHLFSVSLRRLIDGGVPVTTLTLGPLTVDQVADLIRESFPSDFDFADRLAAHLHSETKGNPFFVRRTLRQLCEEGRLRFDFRAQSWVCDLEVLVERVSPDVVELIGAQLERMGPELMTAIQVAACIGNEFRLETLAAVLRRSPHEVHVLLWPTVMERLIVVVEGREWSELGPDAGTLFDANAGGVTYRFRHDRVQQAAYSLIEPARLPSIHLALCRQLRSTHAEDNHLFETVDHCVSALASIDDEREAEAVTRLILKAATRAVSTGAAVAARAYCQAALQVLDKVPAVAYPAYSLRGESEVLLGEYDRARDSFGAALAHATTKLERVAVLTLLMELHVSCGKLDEALQTLLAALRPLGVIIDAGTVAAVARDAATTVHRARHGRSAAEIVAAPEPRDPEVVALHDVLGRAIDTAYMNGRDWVVAVAAIATASALEHGATSASCMTFATYGLVDAEPETAAGFALRAEYGRIGAALAERHNVIAWVARANVSNPQHFDRTFREAIVPLDRAAEIGWRSNALTWGAYADVRVLYMMLAAGIPLGRIDDEVGVRSTRIRRASRGISEVCCDALADLLVPLTQSTEAPWLLGGTTARAALIESRAHASGPWVGCHVLALQLLLAVIHERWDIAANTLTAIAPLRHALLGMAHEHLVCALEASTIAATATQSDATAVERVAAIERLLATRVGLSPDHLPSLELVRGARAELARDHAGAIAAYARAAESAHVCSQPHLRALACERAAAVARRGSWPARTRFYVTEAHDAWREWGARARARTLVELDPTMFVVHSDSADDVASLDIESLLKSTQAISSTLHLGELQRRLMHIVLENAGAHRGLLVVDRDGVAVVEAESSVEGSAVVTTLPSVALSSNDVAHGLVQRTLRTGETIILDDASLEFRFGLSRFSPDRRPRSTLTMPIESHGRRIGVLHVEHREVAHAFRANARRVLGLLVGHAVTALDNARLYGDLQAEIEERQRTETALRAERDRSATILETLPLLACVVRHDGAISFVNPAIERLLGVSAEALNGRSWWELHVDPSERATLAAMLARDGIVRGHETKLVTNVGETRIILWTCIRPTGPNGPMIGFGEDVTDERRRERDRRALEDHLQRAQQLQTVGTLAMGIAHDFNNLLVPITSYVELLSTMLPPSSPESEYVQEIGTAATRAAELARRVLATSRTSTSARQPVVVPDVVREVARLLAASLGARIEVRVEIAADCPTILGDANQLHQVLLNLGTNAGHAMQSKPGVLTFRVVRSIHPVGSPRVGQACVQISVVDTGHGMNAATLAQIFDPFFTTKPVGEGTGLGLWMVHNLVEAAGGEIRVASSPGVGTTFDVHLPAVEVAIDRRRKDDTPTSGTERVLVLDDEAAIARVLTRALEREGYAVSSFTSPLAALEALAATPRGWDVILTDYTMPVLDGIAFATRLAAAGSEIPIVMMTGAGSTKLRAELTAVGIRELTLKPMSIPDLTAAIRRVLSR